MALKRIRCTACVATLVLFCTFVKSERAAADAGAPTAPVPGAAGAPGSDEAVQETEGAAGAASEHIAEAPSAEREAPPVAPDEVTEAAAADVVPEQAVVVEQPLFAQPEAQGVSANNTDESANGVPERRDFLRRLRSTAENIERLRSSERTEVRTEGDITVLTNVAPMERPEEPVARPVLAVIPAAPVASGEVSLPSSEEPVAAALESRPAQEPPGHWHWLWILAGVATVLLVPIGMLLTRATRSS